MKALLVTLFAASAACSFPSAYAASTNLVDRQTVIVTTHADDEQLWDSTLLKTAKAIVVGGPAVGHVRRDAILKVFSASGPYGYKPVHFAFPPIHESTYVEQAMKPCLRDLETYSYQKTYDALRPILQNLKNQGMIRVATHNPWGEYGHPNHRTVSAAIRNLGEYGVGFDVWHNAVAHTGTTKTIAEGGRYLDALFLTGVTYSPSRTSTLSLFKIARSVYQNAVFEGRDMWTWHDADTEYASGYRKYWRAVVDGRNLLTENAALEQQVRKIRTDIPYAPGEANSQYKVPPFYTCASPQADPVYFGGIVTMSDL